MMITARWLIMPAYLIPAETSRHKSPHGLVFDATRIRVRIERGARSATNYTATPAYFDAGRAVLVSYAALPQRA